MLKAEYISQNTILKMWKNQKYFHQEIESLSRSRYLNEEEKADLKLLIHQYPGLLKIVRMEEELEMRLENLK